MKRSLITSALIAAALLMAASLSFAVDDEHWNIGDTKATDKTKSAGKAAKLNIVDINSAGKAALKTLPGVSDAQADRIIAGRPYLSKAELVTEKILTQDDYENLKYLIVAKPNKAAAAKLKELKKARGIE